MSDPDDLTSQGSPGCWELEVTMGEALQLAHMIGEDMRSYGTLIAVLDGPEGYRAVFQGGTF